MKFYNRDKELDYLRKIAEDAKTSSRMTVIVGRRRIGKTKLIKEAYKKRTTFLSPEKMKSCFVKSL